MGNIILTEEKVKRDVTKLVDDACAKSRELKGLVDFKAAVENAFTSRDYNYTVESNGDFRLVASPGMYISATWNEARWELSLELSYEEIRVKKFMDLYVSPTSLRKYIPVFDAAINSLQNLYNDYEEKTKARRSSELLRTLVTRALRKYKVSDVKIEPGNVKGGLLKLTRRVEKKMYLTTMVDFDNYEERCLELSRTLENISACNMFKLPKSMEFFSNSDNSDESVIKVTSSGFHIDNKVKMYYINAPTVEIGKYDPQLCDSELINALTELGFVFVIRKNEFHIRLNGSISIYRKGTETWLVSTTSRKIMPITKKMDISKETFLTLLRYIAIASTVQKGYKAAPVSCYHDEFEPFDTFLQPIFKICLPGGSFLLSKYHVWIKVFFSEDKKWGVKWSRNCTDWLETLFYVIQNFEKLKVAAPLGRSTINASLMPSISLIVK